MVATKTTLMAIFVAAVTAMANGQDASETVTVSVTMPVNIPLEVPAGMSFGEAASNFVKRNGLAEENVATIEGALVARWDEMQKDNQKKNLCSNWQMQHSVHPLKDWGTLPAESRVEWLKLDCDSLVPSEPPAAIATLDVQVGDTTLILRAFDGDTVQSSVERFTATYGINYEQFGQTLVDGLLEKLKEQAKEQVAQQQEKEKDFLFSIPVSVDGKLVRLRVYQGDVLDEIVSKFCKEYGVNEEEAGDVIKKLIVDTTAQLQNQLNQKASDEQKTKQAIEKADDPKLLLDIPINVNGEEFNMQLYDGDYVDTKINDFCAAHNLDLEVHGKQLLQFITEKTQALQGN